MRKNAFTMAEIVVAIIVMAVIVAVVVPITRDKFEKVDYASYYMGYKTAQNFNFLLQNEIIKKEGPYTSSNVETDNSSSTTTGTCSLSSGICFQTPVNSATLGYLTKAQCEAVKDSLGIKICPTDRDYWAAMVQHCGGVQYLPTYEETQKMLNYLYGLETTTDISGSGGGYNGWVNNGTLNRDHAAMLGIPNEAYPVIVNSKVSDTGTGASYPSCGGDNVIWWNYGRDCCSSSNFFAFCKTPEGLGGIKDPSKESEEENKNNSSDNLNGVAEGFETTAGFCELLYNNFNLPSSHKKCDVTNTEIQQAALSKDFSNLTPHIKLPNGLKVYIASDLAEIAQLSDSTNERDQLGFTVYIDVDGSKSKTRLYDDVFPFYLTKSGKIIPGYDPSTIAGANSEKNLAFDLLYDEFNGTGSRKLKMLQDDVTAGADLHSFKNVACLAGYVKSTTYCGFSPDAGKTVNGVNCNTNNKADCRLRVRKPLRIFN